MKTFFPEEVCITVKTVPDSSRESLYTFDPLPLELPVLSEQQLPHPGTISNHTITAFESFVGDEALAPRGWIDDCLAVERGGKNRDGMIKLLRKMQAAHDAPAEARRQRDAFMRRTAELGRIAAVGVFDANAKEFVLLPSKAEDGESEDQAEAVLIQQVLTVLENAKIVVGWNLRRTVIEPLLVRAALIGSRQESPIMLPSRDCWRDLAMLRYATQFRDQKLATISKLYGFELLDDVDPRELSEDQLAVELENECSCLAELNRVFYAVAFDCVPER